MSKWRGPSQQAQWLAETLGNRITKNVKVSVKELVHRLKSDYKKNTTCHQIWRARNLVEDVI
jgi:hypothetical protein